jgi:hypothetical protein
MDFATAEEDSCSIKVAYAFVPNWVGIAASLRSSQ